MGAAVDSGEDSRRQQGVFIAQEPDVEVTGAPPSLGPVPPIPEMSAFPTPYRDAQERSAGALDAHASALGADAYRPESGPVAR